MDYHLEYVQTKRGNDGQINVRDGTSDLSLALGSFSNHWAVGGDEYGLADLHISGVFVDIGAHIGVVSLAVLLDNPEATAILVEPFPENLGMARETMAANGLSERCTFIQAAVGRRDITYGGEDADDRFVGNIGSHDGPTIRAELVTLPQLVKMAGHIAALKTDCEGGEWAFLRSKAVADVDLIFGEWHGSSSNRDGSSRLHRLLDRTHDIVAFSDDGGVGLFRAVRR